MLSNNPNGSVERQQLGTRKFSQLLLQRGRRKNSYAFLWLAILTLFQSGCGYLPSGTAEAVVLRPQKTSAGKMSTKEAVAVIDRYFGPKELPAEITGYIAENGTPGPLRSLQRSFWNNRFYLFTGADKVGASWNQFHAKLNKPQHWYRIATHGHYERLPVQPRILWADVGRIERVGVYGASASSILLLDRKGIGLYQLALSPDRDQNVSEQKEVLAALFALCANLRRVPRNGGAGSGRIYFYRGGELTGSGIPLGILLNGILVGSLDGPSCSFYVDEPAGRYEAGCIDLRSPKRMPGSKGLAVLNVGADESEHIRVRIHIGFLGMHPKAAMTVTKVDRARRAEKE